VRLRRRSDVFLRLLRLLRIAAPRVVLALGAFLRLAKLALALDLLPLAFGD
jgi:hypothetical protein